MNHILQIDRFDYYPQTTIGRLLINKEYFSYALEDTVRGWGIKVKGHTALPSNYSAYKKDGIIKAFKIAMTQSRKFGREMPIIYNVEAREGEQPYILRFGGIEFKGSRFHGGNDHKDTESCPLVAKNFDSNKIKVWGSMEEELNARICDLMNTGDVYLVIRNLPQAA